MEKDLTKNIENGMRAIRLGTKTIADAKVGLSLNKLKAINEGLYLDLMKQYKDLLNERKDK